jgi:DNA-binding transcriptional regulator/RsmH inhibitor MraZ
LVANFLEDDKTWVGKLLEEDADIRYRNRQKVIQSLSYAFENDCRTVFENLSDPNEVIKTDGDYPILLTKALRKEITIETLVILNKILNFFPMWDKKITDTIRWPDFRRKCEKYASFLPQDVVKFKLILKKVLE